MFKVDENSYVMFKVALVGHSQIPKSLNVNGAEIRILRAPGGKTKYFSKVTFGSN